MRKPTRFYFDALGSISGLRETSSLIRTRVKEQSLVGKGGDYIET